MANAIKIKAGNIQIDAELYDSPTAKSIADLLPIEGQANRWGGEIYFSIPITAELESDSRQVLEEGELAFWPPGNAFCIFWGPTPDSQGNEIRAASDVNIVGKLNGNLSDLWDVPDGATVIIEKA